jgi:flagellin-like protein
MAFTKKNEEAVSPVIGVILMVAITVILAAVIAAFVFGMANNIQKTHVVSVTVQKMGTTQINVVDNGGQDQGSLAAINVTDRTIAPTSCVQLTNTANSLKIGSNCRLASPTVGDGINMTYSSDLTSPHNIVIIGTFTDGSTQILLDTTV